jgi:RNA polymerase sigma factor (TIGR02999 family)
MSRSASPQWNDRAHFFRAAAEAMRQILIDQARRKSAQKRGSNKAEELHESQIECRAPSLEILAVHEALDRLEEEDPLAAEVVKLRYFAGMSVAEVAEALGLAPRTVDRHWAFARAWLEREIKNGLND